MDTRTDGPPMGVAPCRVEPGHPSPDRSPVRGSVAARPDASSPGLPPGAGPGRPPHPTPASTPAPGQGPGSGSGPALPDGAPAGRAVLRPTLRMLAAAGYDLQALAAEGRALERRITAARAGSVTVLRPAAGAER